MKTMRLRAYILALTVLFAACEQEQIELQPSEPDLTNVGDDQCPSGATAGSANFTKYVAVGNSLTAGFQAGALFTDGQNNSMAAILATQFRCVGGGDFTQPSINSELGWYFTSNNPLPNGTVLGRLLLQGTPASPTPTISNTAALPSPLNPNFVYSGDKSKLNNFAVPGIQLGQILTPVTGDWTKADLDPATPGAQPDPRFNPYYARFASNPGTSTILGDATGALANGGTFFSFWLGNNDVLGYAIGGATNPAILTSEGNFTNFLNLSLQTLLSVPNVKGVVGNIPNVTAIPYFTTVRYNAVTLDQATANQLNGVFAGYNQILDVLKGVPFNYPASSLDSRKVSFNSTGNNSILIQDETLNDLGDEFDILLGAGAISSAQREALRPYQQVRQTTATDLILLPAGAILGRSAGSPTLINGLTVPLQDQFVLIPSEIQEIQTRTAAFNTAISNAVTSSGDRLALADVFTRFNELATARAAVINGVTITPTLAPPTGGFSEDGIHPNNRGIAFMANIFIDAINSKFGASVPKANLSKYSATALPINP